MITIRARESFARLIILLLLTALSTQAAESQQPSTQEPGEEELAKKTQNPVADLISVPLQNNWNFGTGSNNRTFGCSISSRSFRSISTRTGILSLGPSCP